MVKYLTIGTLLLLGACQSLSTNPHDAGRALNGPLMVIEPEWNSRFTATSADARGPLAREFAYAKISESDRRCEDYLIGLSAGNNSFGTLLDLGALGLSLVGAGTSSLANANDLAKGTGLLQSLRSAATDNLFAGQEFGLIYDTVQAGRLAEQRELIKSVEAGRFDTWGPEGILAVANAYNVKCGVNYAAMLIRTALVKNPPAATNAIPPASPTPAPAAAPAAAAPSPAPGPAAAPAAAPAAPAPPSLPG
jgi:hypothetical protein